MQAEALQPINNNGEDDTELPSSAIPPVDQFSNEFLEEAVQFLRLQVRNLFLFLAIRVSELLFSGGADFFFWFLPLEIRLCSG